MWISLRRFGDDFALNAEELADLLWQRLQQKKPRALLIGKLPIDLQEYNYVNEKPYEAVVIGLIPPGDLLHMPNNTVCEALLEGLPVWYWKEQPFRTASHGKALCHALQAAEQRLKQYGVQTLSAPGKLVTAAEARRLKQLGETAEGRLLTPLARDILEGKSK